MQLNPGMKLHGFTLKRSRYITEQEATLYEFVHDKTGAELCYMDSDIDNKLFYVAFKTIPFDNTGVFHILEHSVLCGSDLYPVREPFVELLKSSMQTFLNAMTFPDKTVYPCSSRNEKDFLNLTKVYLDAVFAPRCIIDENIFLQEGWHCESDETGDRFKGVVFNEMKGAMSGADSITERSLGHLLFPDTCYGYNSGGDPKSIPDLTYDSFKKAYAKFYHPSNCKLYLDGNIPIEKTLALINSYLCKFNKLDSLPDIEFQIPVNKSEEVFYAINSDEDESGKSFFTLARIFTNWDEKEKTAAMILLIEALTDSNSSPLKKAILDKELGEDIEVNLETGTAQSILSITVRNTDKEKEEAILEAWEEGVLQLIHDGIDRKEIEAGISAFEYRLREPSEPRGLYRGITALDSWLYGGDPALYLGYEELLQELQKRLDNNGFDELLYELLPTAKGMSKLWTLPSKSKSNDDLQEENRRIAEFVKLESKEENQLRRNKNFALETWQNTPDTMEQLQTLPALSLQDIPCDLCRFPTETRQENQYAVISHKTITNGIVYANYYFKLTDIPVDKLAYLNFLASLLIEIPTSLHPDIRELQRQIKLLTGNIDFSIRTESKEFDADRCTPFFVAKISTVPRNIDKAVALLTDILLRSDLSDKEIIHRVLLQEKEAVRQHIIMRGESAGITEALSSCTARYAVSAQYSGYGYYQFLCAFSDSFDRMLPQFCELVSYIQKNTFTISRVILSLTASDIPSSERFLCGFKVGNEIPDSIYPTIPPRRNTGIKLPLPIGFAASAWYNDRGKNMKTGSLSVAAKILSLNTLWNKIRVNGGAYGAGFSSRRDNCFVCYSFRDPTPLKSLGIFREMGNELIKWCDGPETLDKYIISTVSEMEPLISTSAMAELEDSRFICGYTHKMRTEFRQQLLTCDKNAIRGWAEIFDRFSHEMSTCLVGGEMLINEPGRYILDL